MNVALHVYCPSAACAATNPDDPGSYLPMMQMDAWEGETDALGSAEALFECPGCKKRVVVDVGIYAREDS
jgi:hypothetical protein